MPLQLSSEERVKAEQSLAGLGLSAQQLQQTLGNVKLTRNLQELICKHGLEGGCSREMGALIMMVGTKYPAAALRHRDVLVHYITAGKITRNDQCMAALRYLASVGDSTLNVASFERESGVGIKVSPEEVKAGVAAVCQEHRKEIEALRYQFNFMKLVQPVKQIGNLVWADIALIKAALDDMAVTMLGPKTDTDVQAASKPTPKLKKTKAAPQQGTGGEQSAQGEVQPSKADEAWRTADPYQFLPEPQDNTFVHEEVHFSDGHIERYCNTKEQLEEHLLASNGKVVTRFPPEPNGYLHIGHAKAMFVDFGMAERYGGKCYLRFDDTNPEAEEQEYIEHIKEIVTWMGWTYCEVTHSSDYFTELYNFAIQLIDAGLAYVCHQSSEEIRACREKRGMSPWRERPIEESRRLFEDMRRCVPVADVAQQQAA